jgi:Mg2+-importing ATPase
LSGIGPTYWTLGEASLLAGLDTSRAGLTTAEATSRLGMSGPNSIAEDAGTARWRLLARQAANPLVLILLFGASISLVLREWIDALIIITIVAGSSFLGFWQELRASTALAALRQRLALSVSACRDGDWVETPVNRLVPGDMIRLSAGNLVPADAVILEARDFLVSEAALTGESFPVEKQAGASRPEAPLAERRNCLFLGTSVRSGTATAVVVETGTRTELGRIAGRLGEPAPETDFARGLRQFGYLLTRVMMVVATFVLVVNILLDRPLVESLLFAVALAVGLSPELLPAIVSVTLSTGARRLAAFGVIVRHLEAIENLGSIDILCTDKTGTLTKGDIELSAAVDVFGAVSDLVLWHAYANAALETGIANPLDTALVAAGRKSGLTIDPARKRDEIPYDFIRKRLTIAVAGENPETTTLITKGAVSTVLACCCDVLDGHGRSPLDDAMRTRIDTFVAERAAQGLRVLAVAVRDLPPRPAYDRADEQKMTLIGFLLFTDPLKDGIVEHVGQLRTLGIRIKILSGDSRHTSAHVGRAIGLDPTRVMTGEELARTKEEALWHLAERIDIFAEVDPQQKERIIRSMQKRGHAVGYMGDGINDAPALRAADVGISVDDAVDVARESADVILLRPDLDVLHTGVLDGRRTFANTLKYIKITTSANFGNMVSMAIAVLWLPFLPLAATQILLNNFLSDFPSLTISSDNVDRSALEKAQRWSIRDVRWFMIVFGLVSTIFDLVTFFLLQKVFIADEPLFQSAWFVVSLLTELVVVLLLRTTGPSWRSRPSRLLVSSTIAVAGLAVAIPFLGPLVAAFGFVPLPLTLLMSMLAVVATYAAATEAAKAAFERMKQG